MKFIIISIYSCRIEIALKYLKIQYVFMWQLESRILVRTQNIIQFKLLVNTLNLKCGLQKYKKLYLSDVLILQRRKISLWNYKYSTPTYNTAYSNERIYLTELHI